MVFRNHHLHFRQLSKQAARLDLHSLMMSANAGCRLCRTGTLLEAQENPLPLNTKSTIGRRFSTISMRSFQIQEVDWHHWYPLAVWQTWILLSGDTSLDSPVLVLPMKGRILPMVHSLAQPAAAKHQQVPFRQLLTIGISTIPSSHRCGRCAILIKVVAGVEALTLAACSARDRSVAAHVTAHGPA